MRKKTAVIIISFLSAASICFGVLSWNQYTRAEAYKRGVAASYQRAFGDLVVSMTEIDSALQKSLYATSPSMMGSICTDLFGKAMTAQMSLGILPCTTADLEQTAGFVSRIGDYAYVLSRGAAQGREFSEEEKSNLKALSDTASILAENLSQMQHDMNMGELTMDDLYAAEKGAEMSEEANLPHTMSSSVRLIEQEFPEVPALIYDGPFSEHITTMKPRLLEGEKELSENEARTAAAKFLGVQEGRVYPSGKSEGEMPAYYFTAKVNGCELTLEVSVVGGKPINMLCSRQPEEATMSAEEATAAAAKFLESRGFTNMTQSYHMINDNIMTVNFAYEQDGVLCYSDLIKVGVALDTGAIVGFEARGYIMAHCEREIPEAEVDADTAREQVSSNLEIKSEGIVLIPTDGKYEKLCHEFKCHTPEDKNYIVYVNAVTGEQEKILILIEDESGTLTM